ncbi:MAG: CAP domain-containing protein [bacterium]|nr:CAP domain-containing protein [bacterium]
MIKIVKKLKNHFIPHIGNDYKPHFLRRESILLVLLFVIIVELAFLVQVFFVFDKTKFLAAVLPGVLTNLTNNIRTDNKLSDLTVNPILEKAAQLKANDMASRGYFSHNTPEGNAPWYFLDQVGYKYTLAGENLAVNFFESEDVSRAWMNSPTHRANIVKQGYREIGIAVAFGIYEGKNTVFVVQFFGTPYVSIAKTENATTNPTVSNTINKNPIPKVPSKTKTNPTTKNIESTNKTTNNVAPIVPVVTQVLGEESTDILKYQFENIKLFFEKILTSPNLYANYLFVGLLILISLCVFLFLFMRLETYHPNIALGGVFMIFVILSLFYTNMNLIHSDTEVPKLEANAIEAIDIAY